MPPPGEGDVRARAEARSMTGWRLDPNDATWEVEVRIGSLAAEERLAEDLRRDGHLVAEGSPPVIRLLGGLRVPARDAADALELADQIRMVVPPGSRVEPRPLTRLRRWFLVQDTVGNWEGGTY